jgi:hypothetical protein
MLDVCNCAVLTVVYGWHGKVDWRLGLTFGAVSAAAAAIVSNVMVDFLEEHQVPPPAQATPPPQPHPLRPTPARGRV